MCIYIVTCCILSLSMSVLYLLDHRKCGETLKEKDKKRWEDFVLHFLDHGQLQVTHHHSKQTHNDFTQSNRQYTVYGELFKKSEAST